MKINSRNLNKIIMPKTLSKSREKNSDYLTMLGRKAKGQITPKVANFITLYTQGKISQVETAENMIIKVKRLVLQIKYWNNKNQMNQFDIIVEIHILKLEIKLFNNIWFQWEIKGNKIVGIIFNK